nr:MAG TPA: hypothetical protein [Caudoviricetes sp.]
MTRSRYRFSFMAGFGYRQPLPTDAGAGGALSVIDGTKET